MSTILPSKGVSSGIANGRDPAAEWSLFYFDKIGNAEPKEIKADGANLMVRDANNVIHYKKVLTERRDWRGQYHCKDTTTRDNWYDRWFSFPLIQNIYHLFQSKRITLPEGIISWAVSHRGKYNRYFEDASGFRHYEFPMVTTLYALPKAGDHILYADPFLNGGLNHRIEGPHKDFQGLQMDASASMLFLYGKIKGTGEEKMYVRLADFDTMGRNPFLPGFWTKRLRGTEEWKEVLPPPFKWPCDVNSIHHHHFAGWPWERRSRTAHRGNLHRWPEGLLFETHQ
ncbi:MAG: hypothetical protein LLG04_03940 [Parachlamydia sp.]|nr:hypothetical protein [Parachlamydia sp.]